MFPEVTPSARTIRFTTPPLHSGASRFYNSAAEAAGEPHVARLFAEFDAVTNVLVGPDFVAVTIARPDQWQNLLGPMLAAVAEEFTGVGPDRPTGAAPGPVRTFPTRTPIPNRDARRDGSNARGPSSARCGPIAPTTSSGILAAIARRRGQRAGRSPRPCSAMRRRRPQTERGSVVRRRQPRRSSQCRRCRRRRRTVKVCVRCSNRRSPTPTPGSDGRRCAASPRSVRVRVEMRSNRSRTTETSTSDSRSHASSVSVSHPVAMSSVTQSSPPSAHTSTSRSRRSCERVELDPVGFDLGELGPGCGEHAVGTSIVGGRQQLPDLGEGEPQRLGPADEPQPARRRPRSTRGIRNRGVPVVRGAPGARSSERSRRRHRPSGRGSRW